MELTLGQQELVTREFKLLDNITALEDDIAKNGERDVYGKLRAQVFHLRNLKEKLANSDLRHAAY